VQVVSKSYVGVNGIIKYGSPLWDGAIVLTTICVVASLGAEILYVLLVNLCIEYEQIPFSGRHVAIPIIKLASKLIVIVFCALNKESKLVLALFQILFLLCSLAIITLIIFNGNYKVVYVEAATQCMQLSVNIFALLKVVFA